MKHLGYLLCFQLIFLFLPVRAQVTGEWIGAEVEFDLPKKFTLETSLEGRALNIDGLQPVKYLAQVGLNYKVNKRFDLSFKYRFAWRLEDDMHFYYRNKMIFDLRFDYPVERFKFNYRARFHRITKTYIDSRYDPIPTMHFRNKFALSYNVPRNPVEPSVFMEAFIPLNGYQQGPFDELRFGTKVRYPLNKKHSISGGIMYIHEHFETQASGIIFQLSYKVRIG
jgi:hypothetical protein